MDRIYATTPEGISVHGYVKSGILVIECDSKDIGQNHLFKKVLKHINDHNELDEDLVIAINTERGHTLWNKQIEGWNTDNRVRMVEKFEDFQKAVFEVFVDPKRNPS